MRVAVFVCGSIELLEAFSNRLRLLARVLGYHHCARGVGGILDRLRLATYLQENCLN